MPFAREGLSLQPNSGRLLPTAPNFKRIMTHKRTLSTFLLAVLAVLAVSAQSAREVLDAAAARMTASGGVRAQFKATQYSGSSPQEETSGTMLISGRKFHMQTSEVTTWYDGTTQWAMMRDADEVNVTEPTEEEQAAMNPSALAAIYRKGYSYKLRKGNLRGKPSYEVHLKAKDKKAAFSEIYVDVEQGTFDPLCFRVRKDGDWMRLVITSFQAGLALPDATFTFPAKDHPGVEVVDLR